MKIIKHIMAGLLAAFILPLLAMTIHLTAYVHSNSENTYHSYMSSMLQNIKDETAEYVSSLVSQVENISDSHSFKQLLKNVNDPAAAAAAKHDLDIAVSYSDSAYNGAILTLDGNVLLHYKPLSDNYEPNYDFLIQARTTKKAAIDFRFSDYNSNLYFAVYTPILIDGNVEGYYVHFVNSTHMVSSLSMHKSHLSDDFFIIDGNNNLLSTDKFINITDGIDITKNDFANQFQTIEAWYTNKVYSIEYFNKDKKEKMSAMFMRDSLTNLCYVFTCPVNKFSQSSNTVMLIVLIYSVCTALIVFSVYAFTQKHTHRSFSEIFRTIDIYEMGDWTYRPQITTEDEIGKISNSLWNMAQNLSRMYMDIKFNEHRYKLAMEFSGDLIFDYDLEHNVFESDRRKWEDLFDIPYTKNEKKISEEFVKKMYPDDTEAFQNYRKQLTLDCYNEVEKQSSIEFRIKLKDGQYHWLERKDVLIKGMSDNIEHIVGIFVLIDERKNSELSLTMKATMDSLTGLYNRFTFINKVDEFLKLGNLDSAAVIFVDLDDFKFINDTYGHDAGDDVLRFVGKVIREVSDQKGFGGRYGGDEFLLFLKDKSLAEQAAQDILSGLAKEFTVRGNGNVLNIHSSIGIAKFPDHDTDVEGLIKKADDAMYYSKKNGKNRYNVYDIIKGETNNESK